MFENNKILVVIPARGYSKNIPRKNLRLLGEKPLIYYSIDIAKSSKYVDDVVRILKLHRLLKSMVLVL